MYMKYIVLLITTFRTKNIMLIVSEMPDLSPQKEIAKLKV